MNENTINFERSDRFEPQLGWILIDHETLLRDLSDEQIVMIIFHKAVIRTNLWLYRKHIPDNIRDWVNPETIS